MKTTEELRKELEKLRREEFDACLDFSHKLKPLEKQLKAAETGDLIFEDTQVKSKIEELNKSLSDSGIPFNLGRKSSHNYFDEKICKKDYMCLCLLRLFNSEITERWYDFEPFTTKSDLLTQLDYIENYVGVLKAFCTIAERHGFTPLLDNFSRGSFSFSYFDFKIVIKPMVLQDCFSVLVSAHGYKSCSTEVSISASRFSKVAAQSDFGEKVKLKVEYREDNVKDSDLVSVIDYLIETLVAFMKDKTPLSLSLDELGG